MNWGTRRVKDLLLKQGGWADDVHYLAAQKDSKALAKLLDVTPQLFNALNHDRLTPLHVAAKWSRTEAADLLIAKGADVNVADENGYTPLHWAARSESDVRDHFYRRMRR